MTSPPITRCRLCGNTDLRSVLHLGEQYLTGVFPRAVDHSLTRGPLELVKCYGARADDHCGLVQLRQSYPAGEMYGANYGYRSSLNRSMVDHLGRKARRLARLAKLAPGDVVLDIGSNDGTLLAGYPVPSPGLLTLVGMDPSAGKFRKYYRDDVKLVVDFFSAGAFREAVGERKAKLITSVAMFYDLDDPQSFVDDVAAILADDGVWHLEQSYLAAMLRVNAYDTVCHEHVEYYALRQIKWMTDRAGLKIIDVEENDINGGSFALTVVRADGPLARSGAGNVRAVDAMIAAEEKTGLDGLEAFDRFRQDVYEHKEQLVIELQKLRDSGERVLGYGASTKGNVILQFCGITPDLIPCIADVNADKHGCYTPGSWIPIVSEEEARARKPDVFLVLPWHFKANFLQRERAFLEGGGKLLFPLPGIEVVAG
jgi:hypothetical protein